MFNQVWSPKDAEQLKELREAAQIDISILAKTYALSVAQLRQLENGGDSAFYSPAIKNATGRKLLMHFGVDIKAVSEKGDKKQEFASLNTPKNIFIEDEIREKHKIFRWGLLVKVLILLLPVLFLVNSFSEFKEFASQIFYADNQPSTLLVEKNTIETPSRFMHKSNFDTNLLSATNKKFECDWESLAVPIMAFQPSKPGNYVHLVANADADICLKDYEGKTSYLQMKNGQMLTIKGIPPFEIFGKNLKAFKIYYQGNLLRLPVGDITRISLKEQKYE